ncbi:YeeE/YedE family protein [Polymorphum gilvum]|uniref:Probable transmembrane protein n=1 Tax=Polymorphum gilvum (strain LMG 25793 / CGMCC 1.9160 / SL003B-26A1) TaxID=991905 RepID=F2IVG2_POLGS|nr:YeeE/YedE family protein [Polymorphum gilvum]ADZ72680.1 Probable transmembrane protein [Polymorphum gilvum SL003B-26A1]
METDFTPIAALAGGALIGLASAVLMAVHGRIAGVTGILGGLLPTMRERDWGWRAAFILGLIAAPVAMALVTGEMPQIGVPVSTAALVIGGFIVGVGVTLGSGCTSGHGVCGMSRLSGRSIAATLTFMATTALTVFVVRHVVGG